MLVVVYGKAVDDKELGIYIENVFFGGIANSREEADNLAKSCVNHITGGTAITKIIPLGRINECQNKCGTQTCKSCLHAIFREAAMRFAKIEKEMIETESIIIANQQRNKSKK